MLFTDLVFGDRWSIENQPLLIFFLKNLIFNFFNQKHLENTLDTSINSYMASNNPKIDPKIQNKKLFDVRSSFLGNLKVKEHTS